MLSFICLLDHRSPQKPKEIRDHLSLKKKKRKYKKILTIILRSLSSITSWKQRCLGVGQLLVKPWGQTVGFHTGYLSLHCLQQANWERPRQRFLCFTLLCCKLRLSLQFLSAFILAPTGHLLCMHCNMRKTFAVAQTLGCASVCLALTASIGWCKHLAKKQNDAQTEKTHKQKQKKTKHFPLQTFYLTSFAQLYLEFSRRSSPSVLIAAQTHT